MTAVLAFLKAAWGIAKLIPWQVYLVIGFFAAAYAYGVSEHHQGFKEAKDEDAKMAAADKAKYDKEVAALKAIQQTVITRTVIEYRDRVKVVKEKTDVVQKEIQDHVGHDDPILPGWVRYTFDAAALGELPHDSAGAAAAALPVETSTVLQTAADNFASCHLDQERLVALQNLVSTLGEKSHE
jgi:hypothetical protein